MATQAHRRLTQVLDALKPDHRVVFVMFEVEALSCAEIAATLEVPVGTVHSRLHAARKSFRRLARQRDVIERANEGGSGDA